MQTEFLMWAGIVLAVLAALIIIIYMLKGAGHDITGTVKDLLGPTKPVVTPKALQDFLDEPANQPGGFTPWSPSD
jgi:hypothetical protein